MTAEAGADGLALRLATPRFLLRPPRPEDAASIHRLVNDWGVVRMLPRLPFPYPRKLTDEWIEAAAGQAAAGTAYHFVVISEAGASASVAAPGAAPGAASGAASDAEPTPGAEAANQPGLAPAGSLLGCVGLRIDAAARSGDLGYWIARRYWNGGVASEAAGRLARWALARLDLDRLVAQVATDNPASAAVLRRIGFREVGASRQLFLARGGSHPVLLFEAGHADLRPDAAAAGRDRPPAVAARPADRPVLLVAACALIDGDGRILLARRPEGRTMAGLWEFPGGKVEAGETPEQALVRELREELGIELSQACLAPFSFASHGYDDFHLLMPLYLCRRWSNSPRPREGQTLAWVTPARLAEYPMPDADKPLVPMLRDYL